MPPIQVGVVMGSSSDWDTLQHAVAILQEFGVPHEARVLSAHRTPAELAEYVETLADRGIEIVIAAAGMAAHLAGVVAAHTSLPVLGVPMASGPLQGVDALLATVQMPAGVPVGTLGIGSAGGKNAAYLAARILAARHPDVKAALAAAMAADRERVLGSDLPE